MDEYIESKISYSEDNDYPDISKEIMKNYNGEIMNLKKEIIHGNLSKYVVIQTLKNLSDLLKSKNLSHESKLIIIYYNILIEKDLFQEKSNFGNLEIINHKEGIYTLKSDTNKLFSTVKMFMNIQFLFPRDSKLEKFTIIKLNNIFFPMLIIDKKTEHFNIVAVERCHTIDTKKDNIIDVFLDILNILRQFENINYSIIFDSNMIQKINKDNQKYCLVDFKDLRKFKYGDRKKNIKNLCTLLEKKYHKKINLPETENYSSIFYHFNKFK